MKLVVLNVPLFDLFDEHQSENFLEHLTHNNNFI